MGGPPVTSDMPFPEWWEKLQDALLLDFGPEAYEPHKDPMKWKRTGRPISTTLIGRAEPLSEDPPKRRARRLTVAHVRDEVLARLDAARTALAQAKTIQQKKKIVDLADAAEVYARRQHLSEEAIRNARAIRIEGLLQIGEMLRATRRNRGAAGSIATSSGRVQLKDTAPTLAATGLDRKTSSLAQRLVDLPTETFELVRSGGMSIAAALRAETAKRSIPDARAVRTLAGTIRARAERTEGSRREALLELAATLVAAADSYDARLRRRRGPARSRTRRAVRGQVA